MRNRAPSAHLVVWALAIAGALGGCVSHDNDANDADDADTHVVQETDTLVSIALERSCTNEAYLSSVDYPADWEVNPATGLPPCSAFDPDDASMPAATEIPTRIAIVLHRDDVAFSRATDFEADPTVEAVTGRETTVDGRSAVVAELEHTGDGMFPAGHRHYTYFVDLGERTLMAVTHDVEHASPSDFHQRRRILDAMMASLRFR